MLTDSAGEYTFDIFSASAKDFFYLMDANQVLRQSFYELLHTADAKISATSKRLLKKCCRAAPLGSELR
jgi:hypothetical protein